MQLFLLCFQSFWPSVMRATVNTHQCKEQAHKKTQPTYGLSYKTPRKLFHVLDMCQYAEDASRGGLKKNKKRGRKLSFLQTAILEKKFSRTSGASPSSHIACTGTSPIRPCSSSYLEEDFTHFVHFLPV